MVEHFHIILSSRV